jgi:hypothetical protein
MDLLGREDLMRDLGLTRPKKAPRDLHNGGVQATEITDEDVDSFRSLKEVATGEDVGGGVAVFRPGVDGKVGFGDDHHPADAEGRKLIKRLGDDSRSGDSGCFEKRGANLLQVLEHVRIAVAKLDEKMAPQRFQRKVISPFIECRRLVTAPSHRKKVSIV